MLRPSLCFRMSRCRPRSRAAGLRDTFDSPSLCGECASKCRPRTAQYRGSAGSRWLCFLGSRSKRASPTSRASYSCKKSASCSIFEAEPSPMPKLSWFKNSSDRFTSSWLLFRARRTGTEPLSNKDHDRSIAIASVFPFEAGSGGMQPERPRGGQVQRQERAHSKLTESLKNNDPCASSRRAS